MTGGWDGGIKVYLIHKSRDPVPVILLRLPPYLADISYVILQQLSPSLKLVKLAVREAGPVACCQSFGGIFMNGKVLLGEKLTLPVHAYLKTETINILISSTLL